MGPNLTSFITSNFALLQPTLVPIQGGTFMMGAGTDYGAHQATVSSFQMGRTPVTNEQYARYVAALGDRRFALIGEIPATRTLGVIALGASENEMRDAVRPVVEKAADILVTGGIGILADAAKKLLDSLNVINIRDHNSPAGFDGLRQPVINVNWFDAAAYAFLHGGMLPTEWQWEYAARVVQGREGLREYATPSGRLTHEEAHFDAQSTVDVDDPRYPTLGNGLRHMTGNVWEWIRNWHGDYPREGVVDPTGPLDGSYRGLRGGSWLINLPEVLRAAFRGYYRPGGSGGLIGFRVVAPSQDFRK
jgi:formylglycine-generating enzyme required for sulfatase activity